MEMPAARRFPGLELSFPLLARLRRRLYTVSGGWGQGSDWLGTGSAPQSQHFTEGLSAGLGRAVGLTREPGQAVSPLRLLHSC